MSYERTTKDSVGYIANKFAENPGHFAATILRMYWDMEKQRDKYKAERDTLIDDIAVLRANNKRLEQENEEKTKVIILYKKGYEKAHKGWFRYRELTNHIRQKAEANPNVDRYIALVNYIDKLEGGDDGN